MRHTSERSFRKPAAPTHPSARQKPRKTHSQQGNRLPVPKVVDYDPVRSPRSTSCGLTAASAFICPARQDLAPNIKTAPSRGHRRHRARRAACAVPASKLPYGHPILDATASPAPADPGVQGDQSNIDAYMAIFNTEGVNPITDEMLKEQCAGESTPTSPIRRMSIC
jgi:hypothetical protein